MSRPYTDADFSDQITGDRTWRLKEISDLKNAAIRAKSDSALLRVLLRSLVTICYAHWEGHVRFAGQKYLQYVALRRFSFGELNRQFLHNYFLPRLAALSTTKTSIADRCSLVDEILNASTRRFSRFNEDLVNTKANLNFDVLVDICLVCGISPALFTDKATFIDVFLLKRRNGIAHGEETFVAIDDLDDLADETIALMRAFGDALENHVALKSYKSPPNSSATI